MAKRVIGADGVLRWKDDNYVLRPGDRLAPSAQTSQGNSPYPTSKRPLWDESDQAVRFTDPYNPENLSKEDFFIPEGIDPFSQEAQDYISKHRTGGFMPPRSSEEQAILDSLLGYIEDQDSQRGLRKDLTAKFLGTDFATGGITPEMMAELDRITGVYTKTRTDPLYEQADIAERNIRQRYAAQGILDSSIAGDTQVDLQKALSKEISNVGREASLFRYGTEQDLRKSYLASELAKIGVINEATDPNVAYSTLSALTGQRTAEANMALQIALANASKEGFGSVFGKSLAGFAGNVGGKVLGSYLSGFLNQGSGYGGGGYGGYGGYGPGDYGSGPGNENYGFA